MDLSVLLTWQPVFATGGDPGEQGGSHRVLYDLDLEITQSLPWGLTGHTVNPSHCVKGLTGLEREARIIGSYLEAGYVVHHWLHQ